MTVRVLTFFLTAALASFASAASVARSTAGLLALSSHVGESGLPFELQGVVTAMPGPSDFVVKDATGSAHVYNSTNNPTVPAVGDRIHVRGTAFVTRNRRVWPYVGTLRVLGHEEPDAPADVSIRGILSGAYDYRTVRVRGTVIDAFRDEIDLDYDQLLLFEDGKTVTVGFHREADAPQTSADLLNADVEVVGLCDPVIGDWRAHQGRGVNARAKDIRVVSPAPADPFDVPTLGPLTNVDPDKIAEIGRRRVGGTVSAVWHGDRFLVSTRARTSVEVTVRHGQPLPAVGTPVLAVGFPQTDLYHLSLSMGIWRREPTAGSDEGTNVTDVTLADIMPPHDAAHRFRVSFHGRPVRIRGIVRNVPSADINDSRVHLDCDGRMVPLDVSSVPEALDRLVVGAVIEATGVCILETENWRQNAPIPRIRGFFIVLRTPDDVRVITLPSWWTPERLLIVIGSLFVLLVAITIWNRTLNRLVERRSRELLRERAERDDANLKTEERMRLAVELHDSLSQNLTGVSFQIDAAELAAEKDPASVLPYLQATRRKMQNCRENLRNCLWDLRSRAFEERELGDAIRRTIAPHLGGTRVAIDCGIHCHGLSDNTVHAVLCILRELVCNAIRHGRAGLVRITGRLHEDETLSFAVTDDGTGFDPPSRPGLSDGHFGLQGVGERVHRLGGDWTIESAPGRGCTVTITGLNANG